MSESISWHNLSLLLYLHISICSLHFFFFSPNGICNLLISSHLFILYGVLLNTCIGRVSGFFLDITCLVSIDVVFLIVSLYIVYIAINVVNSSLLIIDLNNFSFKYDNIFKIPL